MKNTFKITLVAAALCSMTAPTHAQSFFEKMQKKLLAPAAGSTTASANSSAGTSWIESSCAGTLGVPFKKVELPQDAETIVGQYFNVKADLDSKLKDGINVRYANGSFTNIRDLTPDLGDADVKKLADAFTADPSVPMLAQVIYQAHNGDGYAPDNRPSLRTEAKTLLALIILQYPDLAKNKNTAVELLRANYTQASGLSTAMMARFFLYGDYQPRNINTFSNYIGQAGMNYPVKVADQTVFYALKTIPNWSERERYESFIRQNQQMQASLQRSQNAAKASGLNARALALMAEGDKIDALTLDALGAGPKMAEIRAKGNMLKKEGAGDANLIEVWVNQAAQARTEIDKLLASKPKLGDDAKKKFEEANKLRADNLNQFYWITAEMALQFFSGNIGETLNTGPLINKFYSNACQVTMRSVQFGVESGVPAPQVAKSALTDSL